MEKIELGGMVYEFEDGIALMAMLDEEADRVYEAVFAKTNGPLTLDELREMDGEPVWVVPLNSEDWTAHWNIVKPDYIMAPSLTVEARMYLLYLRDDVYGKAWLAYRRKQEA